MLFGLANDVGGIKKVVHEMTFEGGSKDETSPGWGCTGRWGFPSHRWPRQSPAASSRSHRWPAMRASQISPCPYRNPNHPSADERIRGARRDQQRAGTWSGSGLGWKPGWKPAPAPSPPTCSWIWISTWICHLFDLTDLSTPILWQDVASLGFLLSIWGSNGEQNNVPVGWVKNIWRAGHRE